MKVLGISAYYHDSAAVLIEGGKIVAAAQEERFTRKKHDHSFPINAIKFCLDYRGLDISNVDLIAFYDKPLLKFERLLETYYNFAPKGRRSFVQAMPIWIKEKLFIKSNIKKELKKTFDKKKLPVKVVFPEHHLSHAASAFFASPFQDAAILTIDGVGEWSTASISHGKGNNIQVLKELRFPNSLGLLYSAFTYFLGFKVNSGEYKLMGLAPYGNLESQEVKLFIAKIKTNLISIKPDGSIWLDQSWFDYATGQRMVVDQKWEKLFGISKRKPDDELTQQHCNLGLAIQKITEEIVVKMATTAKELCDTSNLCLAGGVALNCVANGKLQSLQIFDNVFIQPAAGDAGGALGAALAAHHIYLGGNRNLQEGDKDLMQGAYLGPMFSSLDYEKVARKFNAKYKKYNSFNQLTKDVAKLLAKGNAIGWFQGRMEFGPRALGNRSILGDPRNPEMQKKLNLKIKNRESFRPFAPSVIAEDANIYFELKSDSPYMLLVQKVTPNICNKLPSDYQEKSIKDKLYSVRSEIPAVTHVDFSARIQTVHKETNPQYHALISAFKEETGCSLLVNTSFNVRGEPIVCTPEDAFQCFMRTQMDYLVLGNYLFEKSTQTITKNLAGELIKGFQLD